MTKIISASKRLYRTLLPRSIRSSSTVAKLKSRLLGHEWIYDSDYYKSTVEGPMVRSAERIAESIIGEFRPTRVVDVGCGTGALLEALRDRGCEVQGFDYSDAALEYCRSRKLKVQKFDLERDALEHHCTFDVAISVEVAEHLPREVADRYVQMLTSMAPVVVFTAAPPGQGGADHVNEQPPSYWISKFGQRGFRHAEELSQKWRQAWQEGGEVQVWYHQNLMIFLSRCATPS